MTLILIPSSYVWLPLGRFMWLRIFHYHLLLRLFVIISSFSSLCYILSLYSLAFLVRLRAREDTTFPHLIWKCQWRPKKKKTKQISSSGILRSLPFGIPDYSVVLAVFCSFERFGCWILKELAFWQKRKYFFGEIIRHLLFWLKRGHCLAYFYVSTEEEWDFPLILFFLFVGYCPIWLICLLCAWAIDQRWHCILPT